MPGAMPKWLAGLDATVLPLYGCMDLIDIQPYLLYGIPYENDIEH
jgi:hypothetical protein